MLIQDILLPGLKTINSDSTMVEAERILRELKIRHLPVLRNGKIVGMISDKDVYRAMTMIPSSVSEKRESHIHSHKLVSEFMTSPVQTMRKTETVEKLIREMLANRFSSMLIVDELEAPQGIVTTQDLLIVMLDIMQDQQGIFEKSKRILRRMFA